MAGELYSVWDTVRFDAFETCPEELEGRLVGLRSSDGRTYELDAEAACMSHTLLAELLQQVEAGVSYEEIELPLKSRVLSKVVEYLQYHQETAPGELELPLPSDNLIDCGASKWDATFVNVDKELFFELMMAANLLRISSLVLLTNAKAALMVRGKDPSKIRKDFGFKSDFVEQDEEQQVHDKYMEAAKKLGLIRDQELAGGAATIAPILQGVVAAAINNGALALDPADNPIEASETNGEKSWSGANWRALVLANWKLLADAPWEVRSDSELMYAAVSASGGQAARHATSLLSGDRKFILHTVGHDPAFLEKAPRDLREDRAFVLEALMVKGEALAGASGDLREDRDLVMTALKRGAQGVLAGAAMGLRADEGFALQCVELDPAAYKGAAEELRSSREFALKASRANGHTLEYMSPEFRADLEICRAAVASAPEAFTFVHSSRRLDLGAHLPWDTDPEHKKQHEADLVWGLGGTGVDPNNYHFAGVPLTKDNRATGLQYKNMLPLQKSVLFSAGNTMQANMGQSNYITSNSLLDKFPGYQRPTIDGIVLMWGPVGGIGMRQKAFASADFLLGTPELLMSPDDARKFLWMTCSLMETPEWYFISFMDQYSREMYLSPTAGTYTAPSESCQTRTRPPAILDSHKLRAGDGEEEVQEREKNGQPHVDTCGDRTAPLSGWPTLGGEAVPQEVAEGAKVRLTGLGNTKNGLVGTATKRMPDGRWKVELDNGTGKALMKPEFLQVVDPSVDAASAAGAPPAAKSPAAAESKVAAAARKKQEVEQRIEQRRAMMREKEMAKAGAGRSRGA